MVTGMLLLCLHADDKVYFWTSSIIIVNIKDLLLYIVNKITSGNGELIALP